MGGFVGFAGGDRALLGSRLSRMLEAPTIVGAPIDATGGGPLRAFGARDVDFAEDAARGEAIAIAGYARRDRRAIRAAELLVVLRRSGIAAIESLSGEFAIAVVRGDEIVVARDRLGTRPLYVGEVAGGAVAFGTSIAPLVYAGVDAEIDRDALARSLVLGYPTAPQTAFARVRQLAAGEMWTLAPKRTIRRYYRPEERLAARRSIADAAKLVDREVTRAVRDAIPKTGRVGAFLSGGIDSAIVLARLHEAGARVDAYTLHFGERLPGEIRYARAVAEHLGVRHHLLELDARRFSDGVEPAALHLEDLLSEAIAVPNFLLARLAARDVDVLFTGEGGDQSFGGPKNVGLALARTYRGHPASPPIGETYLQIHQYLANDVDVALVPELRAAFDPERLAADVVAPFFDDGIPGREQAGHSFIGQVMIGNTVIKGGNNILPKVAKTVGAANDLALRSPFFDPRILRAAFTIPPWQKLRGASEEKLVLRLAARRSLPRHVIDRPKRGMTLPLSAWFDGALGVMARDVLTARAVRARGVFRWPYVERLLRRERIPGDMARSRTDAKLWLVLVTEIHQRAIDRIARDASRVRHVA
jgi:asparagine synthase (glutamine-hydrolysing)